MSETPKHSERRQQPRIAVNFPVTLTVDGKHHQSRALEFSEFGILIATSLKDLVGESVEVGLTINATRPAVSLKGVVVYSTSTGIAVRFKDITSEISATFKSYIESQRVVKPQ